MILHVLLLFAHKAPGLIDLQAGDLQPAHTGVMEPVAGFPDPLSQAHDRVAVDAGCSFSCSNGYPLGEQRDDLDLALE